MKSSSLILALILLIGVSSADIAFNTFNGDFNSLSSHNQMNLQMPQDQLATIANYFGCKVWDKETCIECSKGYFFNNKAICCQVDELCKDFNRANGICVQCYQGYHVKDGACVRSDIDLGCAIWNHGVCAQCSKRWYKGQDDKCYPVDDQCYTWLSNGKCINCYNGYVLNNDGRCIVDPNPPTGKDNPLCAKWDGNKCLECSHRAFFATNGICQSVCDQCQTWDKKDGFCLTCYAGFQLSDKCCVASKVTQVTDLGCSLWNNDQNICLKCSQRWTFNENKKCIPVDDQCKTYDKTTGQCTSCYTGYTLNGKLCIRSEVQKPNDLGCAQWDWNKQFCLRCSHRWVFNNNRVCVPVSDQCESYDDRNRCVACYKGYSLADGKCVQDEDQQVSDLGCALWDWDNKKCLQCSQGWTLLYCKCKCIRVSDDCATYNSYGSCTSCYKGYILEGNKCVLAPLQEVSDLGCSLWDWKNQKCLQCSKGWIFNHGKCVPVSDQCATHNSAGQCTTCYKGYELSYGKCIKSQDQQVSDLGCALWDWDNQKCLQCSKGWTYNNGKCVPVSDQCASFNSAGQCTKCYKGYELSNGKCVRSQDQQVSDLGCALWDWDNQRCLQCSKGWVLNNGKCTPVSDQCATHNDDGQCTACYKGYQLSNGKCVRSQDQQVTDLGCALWDWDNQKCLRCSKGWTLLYGKCKRVSDHCVSHNYYGSCTQCYKGYILEGNKCVLAPLQQVSDLGCALWDWDNQKCLRCSNKFYMNQLTGKCMPVSDDCATHRQDGTCDSCYKGYRISNGECVVANSNCKQSNSNGDCTSCYQGYLLNHGNCVPLSQLANLALYYSICCPQKLNGLSQTVSHTQP